MQGVLGGPSVTFNPYPYAQNALYSGVNMVDPTSELAWFVAAPLLFGFGFGTDVAFRMGLEGRSLQEVHWGRAVVSGTTAVIGGGVGAGLQAAKIGGRTAFALGAVADFGVGVTADRYLVGDDWGTAAFSNAFGFGVGEIVGYAGKGIARRAGQLTTQANNFVRPYAIAMARNPLIGAGFSLPGRSNLPDSSSSSVSPYFIRVGTDEYGYTIPYPSVDTWNMVKTAKNPVRTTHGGIRDQKNFWRTWQRDFGETLSERNRTFIKAKSSPVVDDVWIEYFPEMRPYAGRRLVHHHVDLGRYAIPLPENLHGRGGAEPFLAETNIDPYVVWHPREMEIRQATIEFGKKRSQR